MKTRILQIALQVALIKEEFLEAEILEAVKFLEEQGSSSALLAYLAGRNTKTTTSKAPRQKKKPIGEQRSQALIELEKKDPEKYYVLSEFDSLLRKETVLRDLSEIRRLGEQLSKDFSAKRSRLDMIRNLINVLSNHPIEEIKEIVKSALSSSNFEDSDYQQLANFIITGKTTQNPKNE